VSAQDKQHKQHKQHKQDKQDKKEAFERSKQALAMKPSLGLKTATCKVRIVDGYTCEVEEGRWKIIADLSEKVGGNAKGPDSGVLGRAAFGSCAAIGYMQWAAVLGIQLSSVEVVVESDYDHGGYYGTNDSSAGPKEVRYKVTIQSDAPKSQVIALIEKADKHSPLHDLFTRAIPLKREIEINPRDD